MGVAFAAAAALSYGLTVVFGRALARSGLGAAAVLGIRFTVATVGLGIVVALRPRVLADRRKLLYAFGAGAIGYASQATLFYSALQRGTAAAVTLLFYAYPAMVVLMDVPLVRRLPPRGTLVALVLSSAGVAAIVASSGDVAITRVGVMLALAAGASFALYVVGSDRLLTGLDPRASAFAVCAGTATTFLVFGAITHTLGVPVRYLPQLAGNGLASASAFAFLFAALGRIGASDTSVVMTLEAFFATIIAALALGESPTVVQVAGGGAVLAGAVVIAMSTRATSTQQPRSTLSL